MQVMFDHLEFDSRRIILVTGRRDSGKTNLCRELLRAAAERSLHAAGVISPGRYENGRKTGILVENVRTGEQRLLAKLNPFFTGKAPTPPGGQPAAAPSLTPMWLFDSEALEWGNQILRIACPCDLLVIDELGPLEFTGKQGWLEGMRQLDEGSFKQAWAVVRPELLDLARKRWTLADIINLD